MAAQYIPAYKLLRLKPNAECCDCAKEVDDAPDNEVWTIWNGNIIYCPKCARNEGIGPHD